MISGVKYWFFRYLGNVGLVVAVVGHDERRVACVPLLLRVDAATEEELPIRRNRDDTKISTSLRRTSLLRSGILCLPQTTSGQ